MQSEFFISKKKLQYPYFFFGHGYHLFFLKSNTCLMGAGHNGFGQLGAKSPKCGDISLGSKHTLFTSTEEDEVYSTGYNGRGTLSLNHTKDCCLPTPILIHGKVQGGIKKAVAGSQASYILSGTGQVFSAGYGANGALGHGDKRNKVIATKIESLDLNEDFIVDVIGGYHNATFISKSGSIFLCGYNGYGQLANGKTGPDLLLPFEMRYFAKRCIDVKNVVMGYHTTYFLVEFNQVYASGSGIHGEFGNAKVSNSKWPKLCENLKCENLVAGYHYAVFRSLKGEYFGTGLNGGKGKGTLGFGTKKKILVPRKIEFPEDLDGDIEEVIQIGSSLESTYFVTRTKKKKKGEIKVYGCGLNCYGQLMNEEGDANEQVTLLLTMKE